jgi:NAD(P)H-dependent flavin oxidoreductase YrpB (nitropropane dioxygenase family)
MMAVTVTETVPLVQTPAGSPCGAPVIVQGGMGVAVSSWQLARAVSSRGQLGVVSGTALDTVLARRLQDGDPGGDARRALDSFPVPALADRVRTRYFRAGGRAPGQPYLPTAKLTLRPTRAQQELAVVGNFVEVWLAKEGHDGVVGVNYLEKVQMATPAAAFGAILAGVDYVLMGAGVPREIPRLLADLSALRVGRIGVDVHGSDTPHPLELDPVSIVGGAQLPPLRCPRFLAVVSSHVLAAYLARDESIRPYGFVVEGPPAGGHNAPPRNAAERDQLGQPVYGPRDEADLGKIAALGLPFWLAGGYGTPARLEQALQAGATGVQVGTLFALSEESGLAGSLRADLLERLRDGTLQVRTDPLASPTGFPFKVAQIPGTLSEDEVYAARPRLCDLGYLREPYLREDGEVGYRCAGEPVHMYVRKGGDLADTVGRKCLCNALTADVGLGQTRRSGYHETALVTLGSDSHALADLALAHPDGWSAGDAIDWLLGSGTPAVRGTPSPA